MKVMNAAEVIAEVSKYGHIYARYEGTYGQTGAGLPHVAIARWPITLRLVAAEENTSGQPLVEVVEKGWRMIPTSEGYRTEIQDGVFCVSGSKYDIEASDNPLPERERIINRQNLSWQRVVLGH